MGQCQEFFCFRFFFMNHLPHAPENNIRVISNFFEISRRYLKVKVHRRYQIYWWQIYHRCAADAAIWAEQQLVAIPGWLYEDPNARLHQEKRFASIKEPRSPRTKENKAKRRSICWGEGGARWWPRSFPPPPHPRGDFWSRTHEFSEKSADFKISQGILGKLRTR